MPRTTLQDAVDSYVKSLAYPHAIRPKVRTKQEIVADLGTLHGVTRQLKKEWAAAPSAPTTGRNNVTVPPITHADRVRNAQTGLLPTSGHTKQEFIDEVAFVETYLSNLKATVAQWPADQTDYVEVRLNGRPYTYRIHTQPIGRRVQVGDLVTVAPLSSVADGARVLRVSKINVTPHSGIQIKNAVAINVGDGERIQRALGAIR